jgi:hypothetical protein
LKKQIGYYSIEGLKKEDDPSLPSSCIAELFISLLTTAIAIS